MAHALLWLHLVLAAALPAWGAASSDLRFLDGLRQRRLYALAETFCRQRLARADLGPAREAELTAEWSRVLAEWAVESTPDRRAALWQQAAQVSDDFARRRPDHPQLVVVRLQGVLGGLLARGELLRQEAQLTSSAAEMEEARTHLRAAVRQLKELADEIERQLRRDAQPGRARPTRPGELTSQEWLSLQRNVAYQLARALRNQGDCYAAGTPDRAGALGEAVRLLEPLAALDVSDPLCWPSRGDLVVSERLLGDTSGAASRLAHYAAQKPPVETALRLRAERLRLALAAGQAAEVSAVLAEGREFEGAACADLDYAWLETYVAAWRGAVQAKDQAQAATWKNKTLELVSLIERAHGPYWYRRAQMLVAGFVANSEGTSDLDLLLHSAENSYRSGRPDDAIRAYDLARAAAGKQNQPGKAFDMAYLAAAIEHQRGRSAEAMTRFHDAALAMPDHPRAAEAFALAVFHAGQLAKDESKDSLDRYQSFLREYLEKWPASGGAAEVRWQLGGLERLRHDWAGAIAAYRGLSPEEPRFTQAVEAVAQCYEALIAGRKASGEAVEPLASDAARWFESLFTAADGRVPEKWGPLQRQAALAAARMWLETSSGKDRAGRILSAALGASGDAPAGWKASAQALLVYALAAEGRREEAADVLGRMSGGPIDQLLTLLEGLEQTAAAAPDATRSQLADLQLRTIGMLQPRQAELTPSARQQLERIYARALADTGRMTEALVAYEALVKAYPRDGKLHESYAQLLSRQNDPQQLKTALAKWTEIFQRSEEGGDRWFRAEYNIALLNYRLGDKEQARRIVTRLQSLYPSMGGPQLKSQFLDLLTRCK